MRNSQLRYVMSCQLPTSLILTSLLVCGSAKLGICTNCLVIFITMNAARWLKVFDLANYIHLHDTHVTMNRRQLSRSKGRRRLLKCWHRQETRSWVPSVHTTTITSAAWSEFIRKEKLLQPGWLRSKRSRHVHTRTFRDPWEDVKARRNKLYMKRSVSTLKHNLT